MQVIPSSCHVDPPNSSLAKIALPSRTSSSPLFLRRLSKSLIADEKVIPMFLSPDLNEPQLKKLGICALPSIATSPICTPTRRLSLRLPSESTSSVAQTDITMAPDTTMSMASLPITPTWIAIPPTPPYKNMRRCNTALTRRSSLVLFTPSTSFPATGTTTTSVNYTGNNINTGLKRCISVPSISSRVQSNKTDGRFVHTKNYNAATISIVDEIFGPESDSRSPAKLFNLSSTVPVTDNEDDGSPNGKSIPCLPEITSPEGSWSDHSVDDFNWGTLEKRRDALRKFHALKELLATEVGYLKDLKALVTVYLRNFPTLTARALPSSSTFGRASSSLTSGPWVPSYAQLQATTLSSSTPSSEAQNVSVPAKESSKFQSRYLFTDSETEALTRNAEELLQLHEHFVRELRSILEPLSFTMDQDQDLDESYQYIENLDAAIQAVATKFATEASRFNAYQSFCAGHPEALNIVRKALQKFPLELHAFEQRCATMVFDMLETNFAMSEPGPNPSYDSPDSATNQLQSQSLIVEDRKRAKSLTSLDGTALPLLSRPSMVMTKNFMVFPSEPRRDKGVRRIAFADYLIKPIQRICKYPLLLDQLLPSKALRIQTSPEGRSDVYVVVESAAQAMRHVATLVDEARHRQDIATQSSHIFSRICLGLASTSALPLVQILTQDFLLSLGTCVLSGSLDVMHYHPTRPLGQTSNIKAKYLGAFLYRGGYLILVKVCKGRKYVPRHWFSLIDFEVSDVEDDGAMLPCSIRLSSGEQHFELAAACKREKDSWLCSINESLTHAPTWNQEPIPSFKFDGKGELLPGSDDGKSESSSGLPTIRSISELGNTSETEFSEPFFASLRGHVKPKKKRRTCGVSHPPSRRSSSTSVKAIFSPINSDTETVVIRRSSPTARLQVDQELQDVISQVCLTARSYAFIHEQELFQAPKANKLSFSRSNSGLSMAGMGRLSKHESVRVPRRRTMESFDSLLSKGSSPLGSTITEKRIGKKLSITSVSLKDYDNITSQTTASSPCPSPLSSRAATLLSSDNATISLLAVNNKKQLPLKPRSFVRNVKDLFHFRPMSPVPPVSVIVSHPSQNLVQSQSPLSDQSLVPNAVPPRWRVGSLRRRARSEPDNSPITIPDDPKKSYPIKAVTSLST